MFATTTTLLETPHEALTNTLKPLTDSFLTIRVIKSFEFRTTKNLLLPHVDVTKVTVGELKDLVRKGEERRGRNETRLARARWETKG